MRSVPSFSPFATRGRRTIIAILATFAFFSTLNVALSIRATAKSQHRAAVLQVAARQRMLAERYVTEVLLVLGGERADPQTTGLLLSQSAAALLDGGTAPPANGDDDETTLTPTKGKAVRAQLEQEARLVRDLTATGAAILAHRPVVTIRETAHERIATIDPMQRLRVLSALTANVSLDAARSIGSANDRNISDLIRLQVVLGLAGLLTSLLLAWALIAATRRQTAHFRSLVTSSHDALTDLPNRALFRDRLGQALAKSERTNDLLAVLLLDLDGFKQVNDSLGHDAGDQLLQHVAERFGHVIRPSDTLARLGGDEFALVLEGARLQTAIAVVRRLFERLAETIDIGDHALALGASVGIALHPGGPADAQDLVRQADLAMYAAKEGGRGRYEVFHDEM